MKITLNGDLGSGKSTVGKLLASRFDIPFFSTGAIFRNLGKVNNMDALKFNLDAENNTEIDAIIDGGIVELDKKHDGFILDSRMAWHFVEKSLKVYLTVDDMIAAKRIMADESRDTEQYSSLEQARQSLAERRSSENKRYRSLYKVEITDPANYDLVLNTGDLSIDEAVEKIAAAVEKSSF